MFSVSKNSDVYKSLSSQNLPETIARAVDLVGDPEFSAVIPASNQDSYLGAYDTGKKIRHHYLRSLGIHYGEAVWVGACFKPLEDFALKTTRDIDSNRIKKTYSAKTYKATSPDFEIVFTHIFETKHAIRAEIKAVSNVIDGKFSFGRLGKAPDTLEISTWTSKPLMDSQAADLIEEVFRAKQQGLHLDDILKLANDRFGKEVENKLGM